MSGKKDRYTLKATSQGWANTAAGGQDHSGPSMSGQHENEMQGDWNTEFNSPGYTSWFNKAGGKKKFNSQADAHAAYKTSIPGKTASSKINKPAKKKVVKAGGPPAKKVVKKKK